MKVQTSLAIEALKGSARLGIDENLPTKIKDQKDFFAFPLGWDRGCESDPMSRPDRTIELVYNDHKNKHNKRSEKKKK